LDITRNAILTWKWDTYINTPTSNDLAPTGTGDVGKALSCCTRGSCVWGNHGSNNSLLVHV